MENTKEIAMGIKAGINAGASRATAIGNMIISELANKGLAVPSESYGVIVENLGNAPALHPESTTQRFMVTVTGKL